MHRGKGTLTLQRSTGVKNIILAASVDGKMTPWKSFMVGAVSKTLATVVTFPYILSKIRLQAKDTRYKGAIDVLTTIAKEKGITGWYQGMQAQITKAVLAQALLFYFRGECGHLRGRASLCFELTNPASQRLL